VIAHRLSTMQADQSWGEEAIRERARTSPVSPRAATTICLHTREKRRNAQPVPWRNHNIKGGTNEQATAEPKERGKKKSQRVMSLTAGVPAATEQETAAQLPRWLTPDEA